MSSIKRSAKVTPSELSTPQQNNLFKKSRSIINDLNILMSIQIALGINRIYLIDKDRVRIWISYIYSVFLIIITIYFVSLNKATSASYMVILLTTCIEYILLVCNSLTSNKSIFEYFISNLKKFDEILKIDKDLTVISSTVRSLVWMVLSVIYSITECTLLMIFVYNFNDYSFTITYLTMIAHDSEQVLYCTLLRMVMIRVRVLKAHVSKTFDGKKTKDANIENLSNKTQFDVGALHRVYELLHKCSEQLNIIMGFPLIVSLFCSGLSTTMLLKSLFQDLQTIQSLSNIKKAMITFSCVRCVKYTLLVVVPCYYSSVTTAHVYNIRTMLHDVINSDRLGKMDRRLVKAFFQLTRENEFAYALWGVIRLNMSLPLSYCSLCTTYLVIIIQFSKVID